MKSVTSKFAFAASAILLAASFAQAHPGHIGRGDFAGGFGHPFSGIDHIMAMVAVGLLASQIGRRALWILPLTFMTLMVGGGMLNFYGVTIPFVEQGIMASVLVLGLLVAAAVQLPLAIPVSLVGLFAIFHGYAHVAEMQSGVSPAGYAIGFITATAILHAIGISLGILTSRALSHKFVRVAGAAVACCGLLLMLGWLQA